MSASDFTDKSRDVREGEELDVKRLEPYLKDHLGLKGDLEVSQFPSGFSNLTYGLALGGKNFVLRRPPFGANIKSAHDMGREYKILSHLNPAYTKVPRPLLFCKDKSILGADFYVMERVEGVILRAKMPAKMTPNPALMSDIAQSLISSLAELHSVDLNAAGLSNFGKPQGYIVRQISGWTKRYVVSQTDDIATLDVAATWLAENLPEDTGPALIHNDYKYDNVVLDPNDWTKIIAILDWEMATVGDPLMDLGTSLGYWVEKDDPPAMQNLGLSPTALPGNPSRAQVLQMYEKASGRAVPNPVFYYVYGLFKVAVILQQIYARYKKGLTEDERFAGLIHAVYACGQMAETAIEKESI